MVDLTRWKKDDLPDKTLKRLKENGQCVLKERCCCCGNKRILVDLSGGKLSNIRELCVDPEIEGTNEFEKHSCKYIDGDLDCKNDGNCKGKLIDHEGD